MSSPPNPPAYEAVHAEAIRQGKHYYIDPQTGFLVMTELFHKERGTCCESACRHCPYGFLKAK